jgi:hypothetical protein
MTTTGTTSTGRPVKDTQPEEFDLVILGGGRATGLQLHYRRAAGAASSLRGFNKIIAASPALLHRAV